MVSMIGASRHLPRISAPEMRADHENSRARGHVLINPRMAGCDIGMLGLYGSYIQHKRSTSYPWHRSDPTKTASRRENFVPAASKESAICLRCGVNPDLARGIVVRDYLTATRILGLVQNGIYHD